MLTNKPPLKFKLGEALWLVPCFLALAGCTGSVTEDGPGADGPTGTGGSGPSNGGATSQGGGSSSPTAGTAGNPLPGAGAGGSGPVTGVGGGVSGGGAGPVNPPVQCDDAPASRAPLRRLTRFEFGNTVRDLKLDTTNQAFNLPSEELGNGFGNDADTQSSPPELIKQYANIAATIAAQVTGPTVLPTTLPCAAQVTTATEATCARTFIDGFLPRAFRRPLAAGEADTFMTLFTTVRPLSDFPGSIAAIIEAVLQDPAFLYKPEFGVPVPGRTDVLRPTGYEMATRLSYLFWGTTPDDALRTLAGTGALDTAEGVRSQATKMLADTRSRAQLKFFFNNLLPIASLSQLERSEYPAYNAKLGSLMRTETETFLENHIFGGPGTWPSVFTADYTYVNQELAAFYGIPGVTGTEFRKVSVDKTKRLGLLSQAGIAAGVIHSNETNPVTRGGFVVKKLLCQNIPLPTGALAAEVGVPPKNASLTTRQRYSIHSQDPRCAGCHTNMDPVGFAFENYDPIGQWRDMEGTLPIDASGNAPAIGSFKGPAEFGQRMAESALAQECFADHWVNYGYGRTASLADKADTCVLQSVKTKFRESGYNVQRLLVALAESDAFIYLPAARE